MELDPHDRRLHTYEYQTMKGEKVFESHVETKTAAAAHRVFWHYGPLANHIIVLAVTAYPEDGPRMPSGQYLIAMCDVLGFTNLVAATPLG